MLIFSVGPAHAQPAAVDGNLKAVCRQVIENIYKEVGSVKGHYKELENLDSSSLSENEYGYPKFYYTYRYDTDRGEKAGTPFEIGVTILPADENSGFKNDYLTREFPFPLLGIRLVGYQNKERRENQLNFLKMLRNFREPLEVEQQKKIPLRLTLQSVKDYYSPGEKIEFIASLTNYTKKNIMVKVLSDKSLSFQINNELEDDSGSVQNYKSLKNTILEAGQTISKKFTLTGVPLKKEMNIYGIYIMAFEGIRPKATLKVRLETNE